MKPHQQGYSRSVRLNRDVAHIAKMAAAAAREPLSVWLEGAVRLRLEREGKLPPRLRVREVTVEFEPGGDGDDENDGINDEA